MINEANKRQFWGAVGGPCGSYRVTVSKSVFVRGQSSHAVAARFGLVMEHGGQVFLPCGFSFMTLWQVSGHLLLVQNVMGEREVFEAGGLFPLGETKE